MKRKLIRAISVILIAVFLTGMLCISAAAAPRVNFSDHYNVVVGKSVTVTMTVREVAGYDIYLSYDSKLLQYTGTDARVSGGGGTLHVIDFVSTGTGTLTVNLPFKTLAVGTAKITISGQTLSDGNGDTIDAAAAGVHLGNSTVQIINKPTASSDSSLKALSVSPGTLSPKFSAKTTSYSMTVSADTSKLAVSATPNHSKAKVSVSGTTLKEGDNWVTVTVTAENGAVTKYTIKVTRNAAQVTPPPQVSEEPAAYVMLDGGGTAKVSNEIDEEKIPAGFTLDKITLEGLEVPAIVYDEKGLPAVYLEGDGSVKAGFYFVDVATGTAKPVETVTSDAKLILADINLAEAPEGYEPGKFTINETECDVLIPAGVEKFNHCLVYAINADGEKSLYQYDPADGTYQRYGFALTGESGEPEPTPPVTPDPGADQDGSIMDDPILLAALAAAAVLLIVAIVFVVLYVRKAGECRKLKGRF